MDQIAWISFEHSKVYMHKIAIFASGGGSNARQILRHFAGSNEIHVSLIVTNRKESGVRQHAKQAGVEDLWFGKTTWNERPEEVLRQLKSRGIDFVVLAGFLLKVPDLILGAFGDNILNIHPALLPKYGGKGMYGINVHRAVKDAGETESGITIHRVNSEYDDGGIVFQTKTSIAPSDSAEEIASKVLSLEHKWYPIIIEKIILGQEIEGEWR